MEFLGELYKLGQDTETIAILFVSILSFICAGYVRGRKKKIEADAYKNLSDGIVAQGFADRENELKGNMPLKDDWDGKNFRDVEDIKSGMGIMLWVRYLDLVFVLLGIVLAVMFYVRISNDSLVDAFMGWFAVGVVIVGSAAAGVAFYLKNAMGDNTKEIMGRVTDAYRHPKFSSWRIEVMWTDEKKRVRNHHCSYAFRKRKCPKVGSEYKLVYSYKYDKVISKDEIRQNRKNCFYGFGMAAFWIIIIW